MKKIKVNFFYSVAYQLLALLAPLVTAPYISRVLGAGGIGIFSYTSSIVNYFVLAGTLGMTNLGNRSIAEVSSNREKRSRCFCNLYFLQLCSFLFAAFFYLIYLVYFCNRYNFISIVLMLYIVGGMLDIGWLFYGLEEIKFTVIRNSFIKIFTIVSTFIFVKKNDDLWKYTLIMAGGTCLSQVCLWMSVSKYIDFYRVNYKNLKKFIKPLFIYFIPVIAYSIYKMMDKVMLGARCEIDEVGYYENALKVINIPLGIINAFGTIMLPRATALYSEGNHETIKKYIKLSILFITILSSAICFGLMAVSRDFAILYYGITFEKSGTLISLLAFSCIFVAWANVTRMQYLIPCKKNVIYVWSTILGAIVNFLINFVLIPYMGGKGAAYGTIAAEFTVMVFQIVMVKQEIPIHTYIYKSWIYILNGILMMGFVWGLGQKLEKNWFGLMVQILGGGFIYIIGILIVSRITKDDVYNLVWNRKI